MVENEATPFEAGLTPSSVAPSKKVTRPLALGLETVAVIVTGAPKLDGLGSVVSTTDTLPAGRFVSENTTLFVRWQVRQRKYYAIRSDSGCYLIAAWDVIGGGRH